VTGAAARTVWQPGRLTCLHRDRRGSAQIVNFHQMGGLPLTIALGMAIAAVLALALTIVASVRQRRRELALLKSLGMRRRQHTGHLARRHRRPDPGSPHAAVGVAHG
jgi:heme exporter protein D